MAILEVEHIMKTFDRTEVLKDISFSMEEGQVHVFQHGFQVMLFGEIGKSNCVFAGHREKRDEGWGRKEKTEIGRAHV